ncbi:TPA: glutamate-5-semialdehyde dehydrogenase [Klebsiella aerogenes]|uniref:Gamma-glutamyl phosphate reductase n=1 Tax=Klebsiella aerogenes (strain ATCC 13048 / DSM 30053 / CCUG 1429 / JCM 1235 / KCTC 2190 / NBRC 13534 / NCIMB 10102 / NCTC 10006 / CDC 819-56) TaxID=1028307 RepID=A0A0H3FSC9_KLEAK|nr:glutamate-5-semialdehyde dehydrogenase [Klebsiella aerogenes]AEG97344.1 gamma-glutamyl phosphate reductase [Klebsiella aerogenes KCTC 2190]KLF34136.1 gamma-glutamyl phosphate reductase [Klebsiella aerogenes]MEC4760040.1 glutamate-5-semialdehyde dehydrogenase [Klebsiella aerogenes]QEU19787.1 glutamate-5-semialdehyde dehydrogenase [Klebsiella aerogenes]QXB11042.1 glutamate-5-semialdehyde dehydrogenase [Klebsiella aerogenes]
MLEQMGIAAKAASYQLALLSSREKNQVLNKIADYLEAQTEEILRANAEDLSDARANGLSDAMLDRLALTPARLRSIADDVRQVCSLADPVGQVIDGGLLDSGLRIERRRVPLGVIGVIYEARPNVTVDVASLCLKTGNAAILRGGKETWRTNAATVKVIQQALQECGLPAAAVQAIESPDRALVGEMLKMDKYIDMLIPRGGAGLHKLCREQSTIPVITGGIGVCHIFVDDSAEIAPALKIIVNAKTQRPSTCNTAETLLVHRNIADTFLPALSKQMAESGVTLHADPAALPLLQNGPAKVEPVKAEQYDDEYLSLDLNVKVVADLDEAIAHIRAHGTQHSDAILTRTLRHANRFINEVDSSAVYVNASTRFTDGGQFGLGAEVAVSTQKLHARGPMGLEALTTYKWIGFGDDTIRA